MISGSAFSLSAISLTENTALAGCPFRTVSDASSPFLKASAADAIVAV
jgi:hypothetical protein